MRRRFRVVLCYDVCETPRRSKLARFVERFLERVQKSTFEGDLDSGELEWIRRASLEIIDPETDTVRIYLLCRGCEPRTEIIGTGPVISPEEDVLF